MQPKLRHMLPFMILADRNHSVLMFGPVCKMNIVLELDNIWRNVLHCAADVRILADRAGML